MTTVMLSEQTPVANDRKMRRNNSGWQYLLFNWLTTQTSLRHYWDRFGTTASGRRVPYRVWARHGAYLKMQQQLQRQ